MTTDVLTCDYCADKEQTLGMIYHAGTTHTCALHIPIAMHEILNGKRYECSAPKKKSAS